MQELSIQALIDRRGVAPGMTFLVRDTGGTRREEGSMSAETKRETGGPAFPRTGFDLGGADVWPPVDGMTLRDYFAAKAMQGLLAADFQYAHINDVATLAHQLADAMLAERSK